MARVCILTDSTAIFPNPVFPGHDHVSVLPMHVELRSRIHTEENEIHLNHLPAFARNGFQPKVLPPTKHEFHQVFGQLAKDYRDALLLLTSSHLNPIIFHAQSAAATSSSPLNVHIIDSQTIGIGLGLLTQVAAEAAKNSIPIADIKRLVRSLIPHTYGIFCVQSLTYLSHAGQIDPAQALVGDLLGMIAFFGLENGRFVPIKKVRNPRQVVDTFQEFIEEFNQLKHIALLQGLTSFSNEARNLHGWILQNFPTTPYSEHTIGLALAAILGPCSLGLMSMDS